MSDTTQIKTEDSNTIYLILDGNKTVDKASFLAQISILLKFPDYFGHNWDALNECLGDVNDFWKEELSNNETITVLWIDPLNFSKYNSADFLTAVNVLKEATEDESNLLTFILATNIINVNTELFK